MPDKTAKEKQKVIRLPQKDHSSPKQITYRTKCYHLKRLFQPPVSLTLKRLPQSESENYSIVKFPEFIPSL